MKLNLAAFIAALFLVSATALPESGAAAPAKKTLKFLTPAEIDPSRLLPPPPADGSELQKKELAEAEHLVANRTADRYARAVWDNEHEDPTAFADVLGPDFDLKKLPATANLFAEVQNEQSVAASMAKVYFHRKFPVAAAMADESYRKWSCDTDVKKPGDRPLRSYPSGHATMGYTFAIVLAELMPEKAQAILARAADYAYSREVCGDHYHSDVEASHALGTAVGILLLNNTALKPDIAAAKAELRTSSLATR
jgi:acid phosphatase (class A)